MNPALPSAQDAFNTLHNNVYTRVYVDRLARHGYPIKSAEDLTAALGIGAKLRIANEDPRVKRAAAAASPFAAAGRDLDGVLAGFGIDTGRASEAEAAIQKSARDLAVAPDVYASVLALKLAELQEQTAAK